MSNYTQITRHPLSGQYEIADWRDDYFGPHLYGVRFDDGKVYPSEQVNRAQLKEFWAEDVIYTLRERNGFREEDIVDFLTALNDTYEARWSRDPLGGEGAVDNERSKNE